MKIYFLGHPRYAGENMFIMCRIGSMDLALDANNDEV
jgi:hypothetical protein